MATIVLGKRSRSVKEEHLPTRSKRRALVNAAASDFKIVEDENESPADEEKPSRAPRKSSRRSAIEDYDVQICQDENNSSQQEQQQLSTPHTQRYRDALCKAHLSTPRHRVLVPGRPSTPGTPRTPSTPSGSLNTVFTAGKKAFSRASNPIAFVGRVNERMELESFVKERLSCGKGGSLYVSGPPGTGKSALVTETCARFGGENAVKYAYVNCMSVRNATDIYRQAASALELSDDVFEVDAKDILRSESASKSRTTLLMVVLDEIDQLLSLDDEVLYNLFEWSLAKTSKLIVVGIANALDLTDRFLPRLKARNTKPKLLPFLPYSAAEIASVLTSRARSLLPQDTTVNADFSPLLHPAAIQLISKKVAAQTGDLRKAFDIAQRTIDLIEIETREKFAKEVVAEQQQSPITPSRSPLGELANLSSPGSMCSDSSTNTARPPRTSSSLLSRLTSETAPRATLAHVVRVTSAAFNNGAVQRLKTLNLQQKAILCSLLAMEQNMLQTSSLPSPQTPTGKTVSRFSKSQSGSTAQSPTLRTLFGVYSSLCRRDNVLHPLSNTEFRDVIASLETQSLVSAVDGKAGSFSSLIATPSKKGRGGFAGAVVDDRKIKACVGVKDVEPVIEGVGSEVLKTILRGEGIY